jgi:hypothetical protein
VDQALVLFGFLAALALVLTLTTPRARRRLSRRYWRHRTRL